MGAHKNYSSWVSSSPRRVARQGLVIAAGSAWLSLFGVATAATLPGAVEGGFSVSATGAATYRVPVFAPPASGGIRPEVALIYSSRGGAGHLGEGWSISGFSSIERCPQTLAQDQQLVPVSYGPSDRYCLDGARLILESGTYGAGGSTYRTEIDQFARITAIAEGGQSPAYFEVEFPSGARAIYGKQASTRIEVQGGGGSAVVRSWLIDTGYDQFENQILYRYEEDNVTGEVYPLRIQWGQNTTANPRPGFRYRLHFVWGDRPSADRRTGYLAGRKQTTTKRLTSLRTQYNDGTGYDFVRVMRFAYESSVPDGTGRSRLRSIEECTDVSGGDCLPKTYFEWQTGTDQWSPNPTATVITNADRVASLRIGDANNDGLQDLYVADNNTWHVITAQLNGSQLTYTDLDTIVSAARAEDTFLIDYDGDGADDLLIPAATGNNWWVFLADGNGGLNPTFVDTGIPVEGLDLGVRVTDVDGDGRHDLLYSTTAGLFLRRRTASGFGAAELVADPRIVHGDTPYFAHLRDARLIDFDGDGRRDLISRTNIVEPPGTPTWQNVLLCQDLNVDLDWTDANGDTWDLEADGAILATGLSQSQYTYLAGLGTFTYRARAVAVDGTPGNWSSSITVVTENGGCGGGGGGGGGNGGVPSPLNATTDDWEILRFDGTSFVSHGTLVDVNNPLPIDINGDGLTDVAYNDDNIWKTRLSNGVGFEPETTTPFLATGAADAFVTDIDRNGWEDVVYVDDDNLGSLFFRLLTTGSGETLTTSSQQLSISDTIGNHEEPGRVRFFDANGDGYSDVLVHNSAAGAWEVRTHLSAPADLLTRVTDGFAVPGTGDGNETLIQYSPLAQLDSYQSSGASTPEERDYTGALRVVVDVTRNDGIGGTFTQTHTYTDGRFDTQGRGFLGFGQTLVEDSRNVPDVQTQFAQTFPRIGLPTRIQRLQKNGAPITDTTIDYSVRALSHSGGVSQLVWASAETIDLYEVGGAADQQLISTTTTVIDEQGINTSPSGFGEVLERTVTVDPAFTGDTFTTLVTTEYDSTTADSCLLPKKTTVTRSSPSGSETRINQATLVNLVDCVVEEFHENVSGGLDVRKTAFTRDAYGNITEQLVWAGDGSPQSKGPTRTVTVEFDSYGQFPRFVEQDPSGLAMRQELAWEYERGLLLSVTDPALLQSEYRYDSFGRQIAQIDPSGAYIETLYEWCGGGNNPYACQQGGVLHVSQTTYAPPYPSGVAERQSVAVVDQYGRVVGEYSNFGGTGTQSPGINHEYDNRGFLLRSSTPTPKTNAPSHWNTVQYDLIGREISSSQVLDATRIATTSRAYERDRIFVTDPRGSQRRVDLDSLGRVIRAYDPDPSTGGVSALAFTYGYSEFDELDSVRDPFGDEMTMTYDGLGRRRTLVDPNSGAWSYDFNVFGELISRTSPKNQQMTQEFDAIGRITYRQDVDFWTQWQYDSASGNGVGRLASVTYSLGYPNAAQEVETLAYDSLGRVTSRSSQVNATGFSYTYDEYSRLKTITYPGTTPYTVTYEYDARGRTDRVTDGTDTIFQAAASWSYDVFGNLGNYELGNGISVGFDFDDKSGFPFLSRGTNAAGVLLYRDRVEAWDANFNVERRRLSRNNWAINVRDYGTYDRLDRLTAVTTERNGSALQTVTVDYSALGNIELKSDVGDYRYDFSAPHQLSSVVNGARELSFAYDANGNLATKSEGPPGAVITTATTWTSFDQPASITRDGDSVEYYYGASRQPVVSLHTRAGNPTSEFIWHYSNGLSQYRTTGGYQHFIPVEGLVVAAKYESGGLSYYHYDVLGSLIASTDASGVVTFEQDFDAFGKRRQIQGYADPSDSLLYDLPADELDGFTGHVQADIVGLTHMRGRIYDPTLARFMSKDPIVRNVLDPRSLNAYSYVENNPMTNTDPTGLASDLDNFISPFTFTFREPLFQASDIEDIRRANNLIQGGPVGLPPTRGNGSGPPSIDLPVPVTAAQLGNLDNRSAAAFAALIERSGATPTAGPQTLEFLAREDAGRLVTRTLMRMNAERNPLPRRGRNSISNPRLYSAFSDLQAPILHLRKKAFGFEVFNEVRPGASTDDAFSSFSGRGDDQVGLDTIRGAGGLALVVSLDRTTGFLRLAGSNEVLTNALRVSATNQGLPVFVFPGRGGTTGIVFERTVLPSQDDVINIVLFDLSNPDATTGP